MSEKDSNFNQNEIKLVHTNKVGGSPFKGVVGWIDNRLPIIRMFKYEYLDFQVPKNLSYLWSLGGILMICLISLIVTGLVLGMHYKPSSAEAFTSVEKIKSLLKVIISKIRFKCSMTLNFIRSSKRYNAA